MKAKNKINRRFLIKQRAFLKAMIIVFVLEKRQYGLELREEIMVRLGDLGYHPTVSEIYKSLFELVDSKILIRTERRVPDMTYKTVVDYSINDRKKADYYLKLVNDELEENLSLISLSKEKIDQTLREYV